MRWTAPRAAPRPLPPIARRTTSGPRPAPPPWSRVPLPGRRPPPPPPTPAARPPRHGAAVAQVCRQKTRAPGPDGDEEEVVPAGVTGVEVGEEGQQRRMHQ